MEEYYSTIQFDDIIKGLGVTSTSISLVTTSLSCLHSRMITNVLCYPQGYKYDDILMVRCIGKIFVSMCESDNSHELLRKFYEGLNLGSTHGNFKRYFFPARVFNELMYQGKISVDFIKVCKEYIGNMNWVFKDYLVGFVGTEKFNTWANYHIANCVSFIDENDVTKYKIDTKALIHNNVLIRCYCSHLGAFETIDAKVVYGC